MRHQQAEPLFQSLPPLQAKELRLDLNAAPIDEVTTEYMDSNLPFDFIVENSLETEGLGEVPHEYSAGFISGLDDFSGFPAYTDVG